MSADLNQLAAQIDTASAALAKAEADGESDLCLAIIRGCVDGAQSDYAEALAAAGHVLCHAGRFYADTVGSA